MKSRLKSFALFVLLLTVLFQLSASSGNAKAAEAANPHAGQWVGAQQGQVAQTATIATAALIEQAFIRGEITANERRLYLSYALYEPQSLPSQFRSNVGWYGTQYVREVQTFLQSVNVSSADGNILMSFDRPIRFPTLGLVDDSDIVKFIPTTLGPDTSGTFSLFFDGSAVDLTTGSEDIDAISYMDDGTLLVSTYGMANVGTVEAHDEDLLGFSPTALVTTTAGSWELYFDGSAVDLEVGSEDLGAAASDAATKLYLATKGNFTAASQSQIEGDGNDIFGCTLSTPGLDSSTCTFFAFFNGDLTRFNHPIDGFSVGTATTFTMLRSAASPEEGEPDEAGPEGDEPVQFEVLPDEPVLDDEEFDSFDTAQMDEAIQGDVQIFLPLIGR